MLTRLDAENAGGFRALLYGVTRNVARRHEERFARKARNAPASATHLDAVAHGDAGPADAFDRAWAIAVMKEAGGRQMAAARSQGEGAVARVELLRQRTVEGRPIREIARGGVSAGYMVRDTDLGRDVAWRVLQARHGGRTDLVQRFVEEAQIGGQLQHPGIVPVYDLGMQAVLDEAAALLGIK